MNKTLSALYLTTALACGAAAPALAQQQGDMTLGLGLHWIEPDSSASTTTAGPVKVDGNARPTLTFEYFLADNVGLEVPEAAMPADTPFQLSLRYALSDTSVVLVSKPAANTPWGIVGDAGSTSTAQFDFSADDGAAAYHAGGSSLLLSGSPTRDAVMSLLNGATVFSVEDLVLGNYRWDGAARSLFTYAGGDAFDAAITVTAIAIYPDPADRAAVESWLAGLTP